MNHLEPDEPEDPDEPLEPDEPLNPPIHKVNAC